MVQPVSCTFGYSLYYFSSNGYSLQIKRYQSALPLIFCIILISLMTFDFYISAKNPNTGIGVTEEIKDSHLSNLKL